MFPVKDGARQRGFQRMLDVLRYGGGRMWVKLTGTYRMATLPDLSDALPMACALIEAVPDRLIWGSDYPHLSFADKVSSVQLFKLLADWLRTRQLASAVEGLIWPLSLALGRTPRRSLLNAGP